jgi:hypothetical protein
MSARGPALRSTASRATQRPLPGHACAQAGFRHQFLRLLRRHVADTVVIVPLDTVTLTNQPSPSASWERIKLYAEKGEHVCRQVNVPPLVALIPIETAARLPLPLHTRTFFDARNSGDPTGCLDVL